MGIRWGDDPRRPHEFEPLSWWVHLVIGFAVGFALAYLIFAP